MAEAVLIRPDRRFVEELIASGGGDLKRCMQCANCSCVCELSGEERPFPRKEMIWAQWGLKEQLVSDPDVWLCHQCNDCSKQCPRGARPGDVLAAVRQHTIREYAVPRFLARWMSQARFLPLVALLPVVVLVLALMARDPLAEALGLEAHAAFYAEFFPHWLLIGLFGGFTGLAFVAALVGATRFWTAMSAADRARGVQVASAGIVASVLATLRSIVTHDRFGSCEAQHSRRLAHLAVFYGFLALFVVTVWAVIDLYLMPLLGVPSLYPFDLDHPMKVVANVGGVVMIVGAAKVLIDRRRTGPGSAVTTAFDGYFVWLVLGVGVTGFAAEVARFVAGAEPTAALATTGYTLYFVHLVLVFQLLVYLPYSKFAHVLYRTVAMVYAEHTGRRPRARRGVRLTALEPAPAPAALEAGGR
jgi:quinone-modifying oxidoreductase subunit QmoC